MSVTLVLNNLYASDWLDICKLRLPSPIAEYFPSFQSGHDIKVVQNWLTSVVGSNLMRWKVIVDNLRIYKVNGISDDII